MLDQYPQDGPVLVPSGGRPVVVGGQMIDKLSGGRRIVGPAQCRARPGRCSFDSSEPKRPSEVGQLSRGSASGRTSSFGALWRPPANPIATSDINKQSIKHLIGRDQSADRVIVVAGG